MTTTAPADTLAEARAATLALVAPLSDERIETQFNSLMSPLAWDLAHIAAYEDLWIGHRYGGLPLLRPELAAMYDAFETPRPVRGSLPLLDATGAREYLDAVRERTLTVLADAGPGDGTLPELVLRHELQHAETMLQALELARIEGYEPVDRVPLPGAPDLLADALDYVEVPGGRCTIGARATGFAYDNERPRHAVDVAPFRIARRPVTNATWLHFVEGGGYERREWWSDEGWAWKEEYDICRPGGWSGDGREWRITGWEPLAPSAPVSHVSWFEADAFARSLGARLPTEVEWEKAATWDQETGRASAQPWGDEPAGAQHATLGRRGFAPAPAGSLPAGTSPSGCEQMIGDVWEWTATEFGGYAGFTRVPLPRVLGGVLRQGSPRAARWLLGHGSARRDADVPQLGPAAAASDLRGGAAGGGRVSGDQGELLGPRERLDPGLLAPRGATVGQRSRPDERHRQAAAGVAAGAAGVVRGEPVLHVDRPAAVQRPVRAAQQVDPGGHDPQHASRSSGAYWRCSVAPPPRDHSSVAPSRMKPIAAISRIHVRIGPAQVAATRHSAATANGSQTRLLAFSERTTLAAYLPA